jgi:hypothetical protein
LTGHTLVTGPRCGITTLYEVMSTFDPTAHLSRSYPLASGLRVRLRLPFRRDEAAISALLERAGIADHELEAARLARPDPRARLVICAASLIGGTETLLGVGEVELGSTGYVETTVLQADDDQAPGLRELLSDALHGRAFAIARARAA